MSVADEHLPQPGDFVVVYPERALPGTRIQLLRVQANGTRYLVRATFADSSEAGPRFERLARELATAADASAYRATDGGPIAEIGQRRAPGKAPDLS